MFQYLVVLPPKDILVLDIIYPMFWDQPNMEFFLNLLCKLDMPRSPAFCESRLQFDMLKMN